MKKFKIDWSKVIPYFVVLPLTLILIAFFSHTEKEVFETERKIWISQDETNDTTYVETEEGIYKVLESDKGSNFCEVVHPDGKIAVIKKERFESYISDSENEKEK